jgi:hypothetical protein
MYILIYMDANKIIGANLTIVIKIGLYIYY